MKKNHERIAMFFPIAGALAVFYNIFIGIINNNFTAGSLFNIFAVIIITIPMGLSSFSRFEKLKILHPIALLISSLINTITDPGHSYGSVFFGLFLLTLYAYKYLEHHFLLKNIVAILAFIIATSISAFAHGSNIKLIIDPIIFNLIVFGFIYLLFRDSLDAKMKPLFDFKAHGIEDETEKRIIRLFILDPHSKAIACALGEDHGPAFIDNRLSAIYKKLGVTGRAELSAYLNNYTVNN